MHFRQHRGESALRLWTFACPDPTNGTKTVTVTIYRLSEGVYEKPEILRLEGRTTFGIVPEVGIDWDPVLANIRLAE
jgi:hypothetical protein